MGATQTFFLLCAHRGWSPARRWQRLPQFQQQVIRLIAEHVLATQPRGMSASDLEAMEGAANLYFEKEYTIANMAFSDAVVLRMSEHNVGVEGVLKDLRDHFSSIVVESMQSCGDPTRPGGVHFVLYLNIKTFAGTDDEREALRKDVQSARDAKARPPALARAALAHHACAQDPSVPLPPFLTQPAAARGLVARDGRSARWLRV